MKARVIEAQLNPRRLGVELIAETDEDRILLGVLDDQNGGSKPLYMRSWKSEGSPGWKAVTLRPPEPCEIEFEAKRKAAVVEALDNAHLTIDRLMGLARELRNTIVANSGNGGVRDDLVNRELKKACETLTLIEAVLELKPAENPPPSP